ncbi:MAG TPA: preprotein translocase subunit SecG [Planctomycetota bacterium]|nr:preprotein translocase subunit SecG [Planctomycetota bacterium]
MTGFLIGLLYVVFVIACILLILVILLQEGKGGGLGEAFGGIGGETFGHKAGGVNKFTATLAAVMIASAVLIHTLGATHRGTGLYVPNAPAEAPGAGMPDIPPGAQPVTLPPAGPAETKPR